MMQISPGISVLFGCAAAVAGAWVFPAQSEIVSFKDAAKIKSWDAWNDHKKPVAKK